MRFLQSLLILLFVIILYACSDSTPSDQPTPPPEADAYRIEPAFPNLSFDRPVDLQHPGDSSNRLFVVEQEGRIKMFNNDSSTTQSSVFLDVRDRVVFGGERGLLGLAFDPDFASNGYFYVDYTTGNPLRTVISRFQVSADNVDQANKNSETVLLSFDQPFDNHNGGQIRFGPEGYLYIATGDGGSAGDPQNNAQNRSRLLGKILRIDVHNSTGGKNYSIPPDNPFAGNSQGYHEEIFAYGLRNPFRFSFDAENGQLWAGDVGQNEFEEVNLIKNGGNYGWHIVEGNLCYQSNDCNRSGFIDPVFVYDHSNNDQSITGGFVYRGSSLESLKGYYIYADYISGRIWALDISTPDNPKNIKLIDTDVNIPSFGVDANNELYFCSFDGIIYRLKEAV